MPTFTYRTASDLSASIGKFVRLTGLNLLQVNTTAGSASLGILQDVYTLGAYQYGQVVAGDSLVPARSGAAFAGMVLLTNDAQGRAVTAVGADVVSAISRFAATSADQQVYVQVLSTGTNAGAQLIGYQLGRSLRLGVGLATGNRPLATSVPRGTISFSTDGAHVSIAIEHPYDSTKQIWRILVGTRQLTTTAGAAGVATGRAVFYNQTSDVCDVVTNGGFANAYSSSAAVAGAPVVISAQLALINLPLTGAQSVVGGEWMVDATGAGITAYVNNGVNIPLGIFSSQVNAGGFPVGNCYDW